MVGAVRFVRHPVARGTLGRAPPTAVAPIMERSAIVRDRWGEGRMGCSFAQEILFVANRVASERPRRGGDGEGKAAIG